MKTVKVAIIGLGKMGLVHASILKTMPNVEIISLCDKSSVMRKIFKKLFKQAQVVDDIEKLAGLDINTVYVTTPIPVHFPIVNAVLSDNIAQNIFVEKTLASNWDKSKELCELASKAQVSNMVGYMKRFAVTFSKAKNILEQNVLGDLISFEAYAFSSDFSNLPISSKSKSRGGVLSDLGSHVIDLALWFFGDFKVESALSKSVDDTVAEDSVEFKVNKIGLDGTFHVSWCMDNYRMPNFGVSITGSAGTMKVNDYSVDLNLKNGQSHTWFKHDLNDYVRFLLGESEYYREDEAFVNSILNDRIVEPSFLTAAKVDYVIDQVRKEVRIDGV
jgi:predicted dehydrogenase